MSMTTVQRASQWFPLEIALISSVILPVAHLGRPRNDEGARREQNKKLGKTR